MEKRNPAERAAFLDQACGHDPDLRRRVEALLQSHEQAICFLERPIVEEAATSDDIPGRWIDPAHPLRLTERPGSRLGPYKLLQEFGEGGMGAIYMAEQEEPVKRRVSLSAQTGHGLPLLEAEMSQPSSFGTR